jgi:hypothetical protein
MGGHPLKLPTIRDRTRPDGFTWNHKLSKTEYTNTQQDLPDKKKVQLDMQDFLAGGFVLPKATKSWSLLSNFSSSSSMLTILRKHLTKQACLCKQH